MKITCKQCGIVLTVDSQDVELHPGLCDVCMNTVPATVEFIQDNQPNIETKMEDQVITPEVVEELVEEVVETPVEQEEVSLPQSEGEVLEVPGSEPIVPGEVEEFKIEEEVPVVEPTPVQE